MDPPAMDDALHFADEQPMKQDQSEHSIQQALFRYLIDRKHSLIVPNFVTKSGEIDVFSIDEKGRYCFWEIKISRSDYQADRKKPRHAIFSKAVALKQTCNPDIVPHRFYYVVPVNLIQPSELPDFAGLCEIWHTTIRVAHRAPWIHKTEPEALCHQKLVLKIGKSLMFRYWETRRKIKAVERRTKKMA